MKNRIHYIILLLPILIIQSCTDVISVQLAEAEPRMVIDAWINNLDEQQKVTLTMSSPYFDSSDPDPVNGATVTITDDNDNVFEFIEDGNSGVYYWDNPGGDIFGTIGTGYLLTVVSGANAYAATSVMNRVPTVDSITYEEYDPAFVDDFEAGWTAEFFARDFVGVGDTYWIKAFKNNVFLSKPNELNFAYDAGFSAGSAIDGINLIGPLRLGINRSPDGGDAGDDTNEFPPYKSGDTIRVEMHSMTIDAFEFMNEALNQMTLSDATIFAPPLVNVPTNIEQVSGDLEPLGCFNVAAVEFLEEIVP